MSYDPLVEFEALAAGGQSPANFAITPTHLIVGLDDVNDLETVFTLFAAEVPQEFEGNFVVLTPAGHLESLLALTMRFTFTGKEICLLVWVNATRDALRCLLDSKGIILSTAAAVHASGSAVQAEMVAFDLSELDFRPLEAILDTPGWELHEVERGWRFNIALESAVEGSVEAVAYESAAEFRAAAAQVEALEPTPSVVAWRNEPNREIGAAGSTKIVEALLADLPGKPGPSDLPRWRAFSFWRAFLHHQSRYLVASGLGDDRRCSPTVLAKRITQGDRAVTLFFVAFSYPDAESGQAIIDQLRIEMAEAGSYICRLRWEDAGDRESRWVVLAVTFSFMVKARLVSRDWGENAVPVSQWLSEDTIRQVLKAAGVDLEGMSLDDVPKGLALP